MKNNQKHKIKKIQKKGPFHFCVKNKSFLSINI